MFINKTFFFNYRPFFKSRILAIFIYPESQALMDILYVPYYEQRLITESEVNTQIRLRIFRCLINMQATINSNPLIFRVLPNII